MSEITVKVLGPDDWKAYRELRLAALRESPEAFVNTAQEEEAFPESEWKDRMGRAARFVASNDDGPVGVVSVGEADDHDSYSNMAKLFGMWVNPEFRGAGYAAALVDAASRHAYSLGAKQLSYWVSTENARAVAFASGIGFRPTDDRRPMKRHGGSAEPDEEEILMVLALGPNRGEPSVTSNY